MAVIGIFVTICLGLFFYWLELSAGQLESSLVGPKCRFKRWDLRDGARARQHPQRIAAEMALQVGTYIPRDLCVAHSGRVGFGPACSRRRRKLLIAARRTPRGPRPGR